MFDVLFLAYDDNANTGLRFWKCARHLGLNAAMFKGKRHDLGYPEQAPLHPSLSNGPIYSSPVTVLAPGIESMINHSRVIHLVASTYPVCGVDWSKKNVIVHHGGTVYRQNPKECNDIFNQFAKKTLIQCPDLLGLGAVNENLIYYPVDTKELRPAYHIRGENVTVGHFPSNPVKGTAAIETTIRRLIAEGLKINYIGSSSRVPWKENLERMAKCDIIIEGCNTHQNGKVYGEWGNTALEASALGCAVVTHCLSKIKYENEFGELGLVVANNTDDLALAIKNLVSDEDYLLKVKHRCRKWAVKNHSIPATAMRLWELMWKEYFEAI